MTEVSSPFAAREIVQNLCISKRIWRAMSCWTNYIAFVALGCLDGRSCLFSIEGLCRSFRKIVWDFPLISNFNRLSPIYIFYINFRTWFPQRIFIKGLRKFLDPKMHIFASENAYFCKLKGSLNGYFWYWPCIFYNFCFRKYAFSNPNRNFHSTFFDFRLTNVKCQI